MPRPARYQEREGGEPIDDGGRRTTIVGDHEGSEEGRRGPVEGQEGGSGDAPKPRKRGTVRIDDAARAAAAGDDDAGDRDREALDGGARRGQSSGTRAGEAELEVARNVARRMGWVPKDEWKRAPEDWVDADEFLERTPEEVSKLRERSRRAGQIADEAAEHARQQGRAEAEAELNAAVEAKDTEGARKAAEKLAASSGPDPRATAWAERNPWFRSDPAAASVAQDAALKSKRAGGSFDEQLEAAEREVRKRFPEHFSGGDRRDEGRNAPRDDSRQEDRNEQRREVRMSETRPRPGYEAGSRNGGGQQRPRAKGWGDVPASVRAQMAKQVGKFEGAGLTREAAQSRIASAYWREQGE